MLTVWQHYNTSVWVKPTLRLEGKCQIALSSITYYNSSSRESSQSLGHLHFLYSLPLFDKSHRSSLQICMNFNPVAIEAFFYHFRILLFNKMWWMTFIGASELLLECVCTFITIFKIDINLDAIYNYWNSSYFHPFFLHFIVLDRNPKYLTIGE